MSRDEVHAVGWPVLVLPYDARWPELFSLERDRLAGIFGEGAAGIEHIGSTAVLGLAAKEDRGHPPWAPPVRAPSGEPGRDGTPGLRLPRRARDSRSPFLPEGRAADASRPRGRAWLGRVAEARAL